GDEVEVPEARRRVAWEGDVDPVGLQAFLELLGLQRARAELEHLLERLARLVRRLAGGAALLGRQGRDPAQDLRELGLASEVAHAQLLELADAARLRDGGLGLAAQLVEAGVSHGRPSYIGLW